MSAVASQITSVSIACSMVYSDANQSSASLAFVRGNTPVTGSPHQGTVTQKMFPFDDVISLQNKCRTADIDRQNLGRSGKIWQAFLLYHIGINFRKIGHRSGKFQILFWRLRHHEMVDQILFKLHQFWVSIRANSIWFKYNDECMNIENIVISSLFPFRKWYEHTEEKNTRTVAQQWTWIPLALTMVLFHHELHLTVAL